jgi:RNA ligase (TIGR02306 family)
MTERKLATIRVISQIKFIEGADKICAYIIDGWEVVDQIYKYNVGDLVIYLEIDSWVPHTLASFLSRGKEPRCYKGISGERLKTIKLKGQISQGLILPFNTIDNKNYDIDDDVTENLGIIKWEPPEPSAQLSGMTKGTFPSFIPKTYQERIQNSIRDINSLNCQIWEVTEKLDGSSMTVYRTNDSFGVCSRNQELKLEDTANAFVLTAERLLLENKLALYNLEVALQGELIGPGIQGNRYKLDKPMFYVFDIYDLNKKTYLDADTRHLLCKVLNLTHAPTCGEYLTNADTKVKDLLAFTEGKSELNINTEREGVVFKNTINPNKSFKVISNQWLMSNE